MDIYAPIPKFDQYVEFVTQAEPIADKDSKFFDAVINPVVLDEKEIVEPKTIDMLVTGCENVNKLGRDVPQKNVDVIKVAITASKMSAASANVLTSRLDKIKATPVIVAIPEEPIEEPVTKLQP
jgi:hypothetical protein